MDIHIYKLLEETNENIKAIRVLLEEVLLEMDSEDTEEEVPVKRDED